MTMRRWNHPRTGEIRVYINGFDAFGSRTKVWFYFDEETQTLEIGKRYEDYMDWPNANSCSHGLKPWEDIAQVALEDAGIETRGMSFAETWDAVLAVTK